MRILSCQTKRNRAAATSEQRNIEAASAFRTQTSIAPTYIVTTIEYPLRGDLCIVDLLISLRS